MYMNVYEFEISVILFIHINMNQLIDLLQIDYKHNFLLKNTQGEEHTQTRKPTKQEVNPRKRTS